MFKSLFEKITTCNGFSIELYFCDVLRRICEHLQINSFSGPKETKNI